MRKQISIFFIGEIGINHNGDLSICKELIDAAAYDINDSIKFLKLDIDEDYLKIF